MFDQKKLDRINELAKKNKVEGLTDCELKEREELRKEYLEHFRSHFKSRLENVKVVHTQEEYDEYVKNNPEAQPVEPLVQEQTKEDNNK